MKQFASGLKEALGESVVESSTDEGSTEEIGGGDGSGEEAGEEAAEDMVMIPRSVLMEALLVEYSCDSECRKKYMNKDGTFKGGFDGCVEMFSKCCKGVKDPDALCAYIGKKAGKIP